MLLRTKENLFERIKEHQPSMMFFSLERGVLSAAVRPDRAIQHARLSSMPSISCHMRTRTRGDKDVFILPKSREFVILSLWVHFP